MPPSIDEFPDFFKSLNGYYPFPWQRRLAETVFEKNWPSVLSLPTASGKTAILDIAIFCLASRCLAGRRRIAFVVDRRVIVDEAFERARRIVEKLSTAQSGVLAAVAKELKEIGASDVPIVAALLRGGVPSNDFWARSPAQPVILCSTVDQLGSRLLFRGYGLNYRSWSIHAGLLGSDTLFVVDEAHCANPFCETLNSIAERYQGWATNVVTKPISFLRMSATTAAEPDFVLKTEDVEHAILGLRLKVPKNLVLHEVGKPNDPSPRNTVVKEIVKSAHQFKNREGVLAIILNRVMDARDVFENLDIPTEDKVLFTGRVRGWERDQLLKKWISRIGAFPDRPSPNRLLVVVATQCIEVGANFDFDFLITECASLDALRQRCGRLRRLGNARSDPSDPCGIVLVHCAFLTNEDPIYGRALAETWKWLNSVKQEVNGTHCVDFGVQAFEQIKPEKELIKELCLQYSNAAILLPAHLDLLVQMSPPPLPSPELSFFLHGSQARPADVTVLWRGDMEPKSPDAWIDIISIQPPHSGEGCPVPFVTARNWLGGVKAPDESGDIEGSNEAENQLSLNKPVAVRWVGVDDSVIIAPTDLKPGDTIVVPSAFGGSDEYGWKPVSGPVRDIGDAVALLSVQRPILRLGIEVVKAWYDKDQDTDNISGNAVNQLQKMEMDEIDISGNLEILAASAAVAEWAKPLIRALSKDMHRRYIRAGGSVAIIGSRRTNLAREHTIEEDVAIDDRSSLTVPITLKDHSEGVRAKCLQFARTCELMDSLADDIGLAGWLHDVGKVDKRFQIWLHGGDEIAAALAPLPLAKSGMSPSNRAAIIRAREKARYPKGARHEMQSIALIQNCKELQDLAHDWNLVLHLVASHHGFARCLAPVVHHEQPVTTELFHGGITLGAGSDHGLHAINSGLPDRFWLLIRKYGWWGLSFLESILRLADHRTSEEEQQNHNE